MTAKELIAQAHQNRIAPTAPDVLSPQTLADALSMVLDTLLGDIDYEGDLRAGRAIAARMLAGYISNAEDLVSGKCTAERLTSHAEMPRRAKRRGFRF